MYTVVILISLRTMLNSGLKTVYFKRQKMQYSVA